MDLVDSTAMALLPLFEKRIMLPVDKRHPPQGFKEGKFLIFIGGGNGSGKTVINHVLFEQLGREGYNRDYIAEFGSSIFEDILSNNLLKPVRVKLEQYLHSAASDAAADASHEPGFLKKVAMRAFTRVRQQAIDVGAPIIIDYHMHDPQFVKECVDKARAAGYECIMMTPHIDAENIIPRLQQRQANTGRPFQLDKILARHKRFAENLSGYLDMFDLSLVLDNNARNSPPMIIAASHRGHNIIYDEEAYAKVEGKRDLNLGATGPYDLWQPGHSTSRHGDHQHCARDVGESSQEDGRNGKSYAGSGHFVRMIEQDITNALPVAHR